VPGGRAGDRVLAAVEAGSGVLTEIDVRAALKAKLDVDVAPQVILGAPPPTARPPGVCCKIR
jgi:uncharacterized protein (DUF302 family)